MLTSTSTVSASIVEADGFAYRTTSEFTDVAAAERRRSVYERWLRRAGFVPGAGDEWNAGRSGWQNYAHKDGRFIVLGWFRDQL